MDPRSISPRRQQQIKSHSGNANRDHGDRHDGHRAQDDDDDADGDDYYQQQQYDDDDKDDDDDDNDDDDGEG